MLDAAEIYNGLQTDNDNYADKVGATTLDAITHRIRADKSEWESASNALTKVLTLIQSEKAALWHSLNGLVESTSLKNADARSILKAQLRNMQLGDFGAYPVANRLLISLGEPLPEMACLDKDQVKDADPLGALRLIAEYGPPQTLDEYFVGLAHHITTARMVALVVREYIRQASRLRRPPNASLPRFFDRTRKEILEQALKLSPPTMSLFAPRRPSQVLQADPPRAPAFASALDHEANQRVKDAQNLLLAA